jgi:hypothetical protein
MGSATPYSIKVKVIKDWIQGLSRDKIGQNNGIGAGTVTSIIQQAKTYIADMDLMRALALNIKKEKLEINYFASAVRLKKVLDRLELSEEKVEVFLEAINIHCFRQKVSKIEFISKIGEVSNLAKSLDISIFNIPAFVNQKTKQIAELDKEIVLKQRQIKQLIEEYGLTIQDLKDFRLNRPLIDKNQELARALKNMENNKSMLLKELLEINDENTELKLNKTVQEKEIIEVNKKLLLNNPLTIKELSKITDEFFSHPSKNIDIIKLMRERYLRKPDEKGFQERAEKSIKL